MWRKRKNIKILKINNYGTIKSNDEVLYGHATKNNELLV